jgi:predicted ferric reductase
MALKNEAAFFAAIVAFGLVISVVTLTFDSGNPWNLAVRLFALNGYIALSVAAIMTAFLKEITLFLKKPFTRVHHYFAALGLVLITLHPITLAIQNLNPAVFLPNVESLYSFLFFGGRQALIIIYIAFAAVLVRKKMVPYWRYFHALMYVALFFGIVHADLSGRDLLNNPAIFVAFNALFGTVLVAFGLKRLQLYRLKGKRKQSLLK